MEVKYGTHERQRLYFQESTPQSKLLIIIHGGAWRDPRITHLSGLNVIKSLSNQYDAFASIDYRLSPEVINPTHYEDCICAINKILTLYIPQEVHILGHSCGAFIAGQIADKLPLTPTKLICLEGIYFLNELIEEYPSYASFVNEAFRSNTSTSTQPYPQINWTQLPPITIIQSLEDELLSISQSTKLSTLINTPIIKVCGKHDEVFEQLDLSKYLT